MSNIRHFSDFKPVFDINIHDVLQTIFEKQEVQDAIISYNQEQLSQGLDAKGQRIETIASQEQNSGYPYSRYTVKIRGSEGLQVNNVDLKVTGELWASMEVKVNNTNAEVLADMNKPDGNVMDNFESKYDFWGLIKNNLNGLAVWVLQDYLGIELKKRLKVQ
jgi:hypothetical protein